MMNDVKPNVAVFISGGGSNLQALIDACESNQVTARINLVVSSRRKAFGLERAAKHHIDSFIFKAKKYDSIEQAGMALLDKLKQYNIEYIVTAGYLKLLPEVVVKAYRNKIINIHPALLPRHGGKGMYGHFVHEAVIAAGDKESGATVHLVDEVYDNGQILEQVKIDVLPGDSPESLAKRVLEKEHELLPKVLKKLIKGEYKISHE